MPYSSFWKAAMKLEQLGHCSTTYQPGYQYNISFWNSVWNQQCSLATQYPQLYFICSNKNITLKEVINSQGEAVIFNKQMDVFQITEWTHILYTIS